MATTPGLSYADLSPATQQYLMGQYNALSPEDQSKAASAFGSGGNLGAALPYLGVYANNGQSGYGGLSESAQNFLMGQYNALPGGEQQMAQTAYGTGQNLAAAMPYLGVYNQGSYGAMSPEVQKFLMSQYNTMPVGQQQSAANAYAQHHSIYDALPYLGVMADPVSQMYAPPTQARRINYGQLSALYAGLDPATQQKAMDAYNQGGIRMMYPYLSGYYNQYGPNSYNALTPAAQAFMMQQYQNLPTDMQQRAAAAYTSGGLSGAAPFIGLA